ncbi:YceI family protein [Cellulophaga sp. E16_2]|uniref:YceI family protein n=1 Tax=Cellulophaga sp. E16_2 TaxID=2789297 RepID=UPI001A92FA6E|nr:YceI family protein [Cellulophaga sp. E16_2]MBO0592100.1 YceI family protein [Cellulophaga sp. E16_2]
MKKNILSAVFAIVIATAATAGVNPIDGEKKEVNAETSTVTWKGYKFAGSHYGKINLKSGTLLFDGDKLTGGEFLIDMATISVEDLKAGEGKEKLEGHLNSDDFFGIEAHNTSKLIFTTVKATGKNSYEVTGDLTIKGKTAPVSFDVSVYGSKATANLKVDRTVYDIHYGSTNFTDTLKDKAIYDEFDLVVDLQF